MNNARKVEKEELVSIDIVRESLEQMPRARQLGAAALPFFEMPESRQVMSGEAFVATIREAVKSITKWSKGVELTDEVKAFATSSDEELIELQKAARFSSTQVTMWWGEMKMQIFEARRTSL